MKKKSIIITEQQMSGLMDMILKMIFGGNLGNLSTQSPSKSEDTTFTTTSSDDDFYKAILKGINAPVTPGNMKYLYAWRKSEGAKCSNNPFNTTQKKGFETTNCNSAGVKNYKTKEDGIKATVTTLLNGHYPCILDGLRKDAGAEKIANCKTDLETWGTGELVAKVIKGGVKQPPPISSSGYYA